ncbi:MAG: hypothetical protein ACOYJB_09150 [Christensenellaceae bacterium]|jgi:hypothetical protein
MKKEIADRITELGGTFSFQGQSLQNDIESIKFNKTYLMTEFEDYLQDELYAKIKQMGVIPEAEITYPRIEFQHNLFTPFTEGTDDYAEWNDSLDEEAVRSVVGSNELQFMYIGESAGYPNYYFICLSDLNKDNPTVYTTDHEAFFDEVEVMGTLEDYFNLFVSEEEYRATMENFVEELRSE